MAVSWLVLKLWGYQACWRVFGVQSMRQRHRQHTQAKEPTTYGKKKNSSMSWISHFHLKGDGREKSVSWSSCKQEGGKRVSEEGTFCRDHSKPYGFCTALSLGNSVRQEKYLKWGVTEEHQVILGNTGLVCSAGIPVLGGPPETPGNFLNSGLAFCGRHRKWNAACMDGKYIHK